MRLPLFFIGCLLTISVAHAQTIVLSGRITDSETNEALAGATVVDSLIKKGATTSPQGSYSLQLPPGAHTLVVKFVGYEPQTRTIRLEKNTTLDFALRKKTSTLSEVQVNAERPDHNVTSTQVSVEKMSIAQMERIPIIMGETDVLKTIQLLPGINSVAEGRAGFIVRGGGLDQNLILMDDMPLYYTTHMQGLFSVFNSAAVEGMTIYKGGIPARYGGRGSSVLAVDMKESNLSQYRVSVSVGLITSKFSLEAPLIKDKLSVLVAGRGTRWGLGYAYDQLRSEPAADPYSKTPVATTDAAFFQPYERWRDFNAKIVYKLNARNTLYLSGYYGKDYALTVGGLTNWGNEAASLRWNMLLSNRFMSNTSLVYSRYRTNAVSGAYDFRSSISTRSLRQEFSFFPNENHNIRFGFQTEYQDFQLGALQDLTQSDGGKFMPPMHGLETAFYVENDHKISPTLSAHYGLRYSMYHQLGSGNAFTFDPVSNEVTGRVPHPGSTDVISSYQNLEPRLNLTYLLTPQSSVKASYNRNAQYLRLMTLGQQILWYDIWMPTTNNVPPILTDQVAVGYFRNSADNQFELSAEVYYKLLHNISDFEDGLHNYLVNNLEAYVAWGKGRAYGVEVSLKKNKGNLTGRISYNYGRNRQQIDGINQSRWYANNFDITNNLTTMVSYQLRKDLTFSANFLYATGRPVTLPESYYYIGGVAFPYWEGRNLYRLPDYHRLDLGLQYEPAYLRIQLKKAKRTIRPSFDVSLYNVYNRRNIYTINFANNGAGSAGKGETATTEFSASGLSQYGFIPSFQVTLKF